MCTSEIYEVVELKSAEVLEKHLVACDSFKIKKTQFFEGRYVS